MTLTKKEEYGQIELTSKKIIKVIGGLNPLELNSSDLLIIGEFTTANGPFIDDWFLTLITESEWIEIPMYTDGMTEFLTDLGKILNADLNAQLTNSADWKTRIMYPTEFKDKELYVVEDEIPNSFLGKVKKQVTGGKSIRKLSSDIIKLVEK
ncbi:hypothetical protein [Maribacter sp. LLG6340-A2]|uniref:hypothetical protein n=1 Tax=Maribacter sp. LLG6340-A2 TaxID=3160834 RepID=UPI00386E01B6